jgi:hypothetical protein
MIDDNDNGTADTRTNTATKNVSDAEYQAFRQFQDNKIRETALAEGRNQASTAQLAEEAQADADALARLSSKGLSLKDSFGNASTDRGRGMIVNLHRSQFGAKSAYTRLRRMAAAQGLVK